jgi:peroxiredoxin
VKTTRTIFVAVLLVALARLATAGKTDGTLIASHRMATIDGAKAQLSDFRGEVVVLNFWASWCAPCRKELRLLGDWDAAWNGRHARVVAVSIDENVDNARRFAEQEQLRMTVMHDGPDGLAALLDLPSMPCTFLLDTDGHVVDMVRGSNVKELVALRRKAESLLKASRPAQKASAVPSSPTADGGAQ